MEKYLIDIHTHILPACDDGAESMSDSVEMAHIAACSGVRTIVATPHSYHREYLPGGGNTDIVASIGELSSELEMNEIPVKIIPGMEILVRENIVADIENGRYITLNGTKYVLVEFVFGENAAFMNKRLYELETAGYIPVIAHPERYFAVQNDNFIVLDWTQRGYLTQINKGSLLGGFGERVRHTAVNLISRNLGTVIASDAHSPVARNTSMKDVFSFVARTFSVEYAEKLMIYRPYDILSGKSVRTSYKRVALNNGNTGD